MRTPAEATPRPPASGDVDPRRWIALAVVLVAAFMQLVDISIVNVAIPSIQRDLDASYAQIQWVLAGYQLAFAVVLITGGRLGDIFGRKRTFMLGMAGFTLASALCGLAQSPGMLIASRVLQGVMGAIMFPQVLSIIQVSFPPRERAAAFGIFGATLGLATIAGPLVGGVLIQGNLLGLEWRPIFLVNVPIGVGALVAAAVLLRESKAPQALKLDLGGVAIVSAGLLLFIYPLVQGRDLGWPLWTFLAMAAAVPVLALFVRYERRKKAADGSPLVELDLFRERAFVVGLLVSMLFFSGIPAFFLTFTLFLQIGLGYTALHAGLTGIPFAVGSALASGASVRLVPRLGRRVLSAGTLLLAAGMAGIILTVRHFGLALHSWHLIPALFVCGLGLGSVIAPLVNVILAGIQSQNAGSAAGVLTTSQQVGGAIGVAVIGVIFFGLLSSHAGAASTDVVPELRAGLRTAGVPARAGDQVVAGFQTCFHDRSASQDPAVTPPSCDPARFQAGLAQGGLSPQAGQRLGAEVAAVAAEARKRNFSDALQRTLLYEVAVYLATFVLVFFLPPVGGEAMRRQPAAAAA
jgi:EmrB/QacA subfamily drug resistance transporter